MSREMSKASEFESAVKQAVADARWGGISKEAIRAILRAAAETVE